MARSVQKGTGFSVKHRAEFLNFYLNFFSQRAKFKNLAVIPCLPKPLFKHFTSHGLYTLLPTVFLISFAFSLVVIQR